MFSFGGWEDGPLKRKVLPVIRCYLVPVARAVRRAVVARPRQVVAAAAGAAIRRAPRPIRPMMLVCRDAGLGALLLALPGAAPIADRVAAPEPRLAVAEAAASAVTVEPLWRGPWGGFPPPMTPTVLSEPDPRRPTGEMPPPTLAGAPEGGGTAVPEPSSLALFVLGLLAAPFLLRRRYGA